MNKSGVINRLLMSTKDEGGFFLAFVQSCRLDDWGKVSQLSFLFTHFCSSRDSIGAFIIKTFYQLSLNNCTWCSCQPQALNTFRWLRSTANTSSTKNCIFLRMTSHFYHASCSKKCIATKYSLFYRLHNCSWYWCRWIIQPDPSVTFAGEEEGRQESGLKIENSANFKLRSRWIGGAER